MEYNSQTGKALMEKYLDDSTSELVDRKRHTIAVAEFALRIAGKIQQRHSFPDFDPELVGFIAYVHDIGYSQPGHVHEDETLRLLKEEGIPYSVAEKSKHGPYLPVGFEGIILQYADMSVRFEPMELEERYAEIVERIAKLELLHAEELLKNMRDAMPRFRQYRDILFELADVTHFSEF